MKFDGTDFYAALIHELKNNLGVLSMTLERLPLQGEAEHDAAVVTARLWFFDRDLIEMSLINAVHNALAYARSVIRIEAALEAGCLALSVRDDSPGYPEHILASLPDDRAYPATGTGLGLQFARLIAPSHDNQGRPGELRLYNGSGAVFRLLLP